MILLRFIPSLLIYTLCALPAQILANDIASLRVIAPEFVVRGHEFPVVVTARTSGGSLQPSLSDHLQMEIHSDVTNTGQIVMKKGAGYLLVGNEVSGIQAAITFPGYTGSATVDIVDSYATATHTGTLAAGTITWDSGSVHIVSGALLIPVGTNLTIAAGTTVLIAPDVSIDVEGTITVTGTVDSPVIFDALEIGQPWGGIALDGGTGNFTCAFFLHGGGDETRAFGHSGSQPVIMTADNGHLTMDTCHLMYNTGKGLGGNNGNISLTGCLIARCDTGGEFMYSVTSVTGSHILDMPNDDGIFVDDDNDGLYFNSLPASGIGSSVEGCFFVTGKDDGIDQNGAKVTIRNTWIEDFAHEGIACSNADTVRVENTVVLDCEQGIEAGYYSPTVIVDHCVVYGNDVGFRFGDSYDWGCEGSMHITNSIAYGNTDNIRNYDLKTDGPFVGGIDISYSMTNDPDYNNYPECISDIPQFDTSYALMPGSPGSTAGTDGSPLGILPVESTQQISLYINEIKALTDNAYCDEFGEFDDWAELYNSGDTPLDLGGMYVTDDPLAPMKWRIPDTSPDETVIGPGTYKIIWLDHDPGQGPLHMDLQLSGDGEYLGLYSADGATVVDEITFEAQTASESLGRDWTNDGNWRTYPIATPGLDNAIDPLIPLGEYYITCNPDDLAMIYANYNEDIDIPITLTHASRTWTDVTMRIRGESSRKYPKKSLRVDFDSQPFMNGRDAINFNAEYSDLSYVHQYLSSMVFNESGHPAFTVEYARLYLNGEFFGLYTNVENVDADFLAVRGMDPDGGLYKASERGACLSIFDDVAFHWDKKTSGANDADLSSFIDTLNEVSDDDYYTFAQTQLDYDLMVNVLAVNLLIGNHSTYYHNYFMYHDIYGSGKWVMLPWDLDKTIGTYGGDFSYQQSGWWGYRTPDNPFAERALACPQIFADIRARIDQLTTTVYTREHLDPVIDELEIILEQSVLQDTSDNISSIADWKTYLKWASEYIAARPIYLEQQFSQWPTSFRLNRATEAFTDTVSFSWTPATDPNGDPLTYSLSYSTEQTFPEELTNTFDGITDTLFVLPETPPVGTYYWTVFASDGVNTAQGYDVRNLFTVRTETLLPEVITTDMTLTAAESPYTVSGDMTVSAGATLSAEPGTVILMRSGANILISGAVDFSGNPDNQVFIQPEHTGGQWGALCFDTTADASQLIDVTITGSQGHATDSRFDAAVSGTTADLTIDRVTFTETGNAITLSGNGISIYGCSVKASSGDAITFNDMLSATVDSCVIDNVSGSGITVTGASSDITIAHTVIAKCDSAGIAIHDGSTATLDHLTFYSNGTALLLSELAPGAGGGAVIADNCIITASVTADMSVDSISSVAITYSLFDTFAPSGEGNIIGIAGLTDPENGMFSLSASSSAIDTGNPLSAKDADGSRTDMGAYPFILSNIIINEINYHSSPAHDTGDWVELFNTSESSLDLSGWTFKDQNDDNIFLIPDGTVVLPDSYLVIANDRDALLSFHDIADICIGNFDFGLSGNGDMIRLYDTDGMVADSVRYEADAEWGLDADGLGATLSLIDPYIDNSIASSWTDSVMYGTPGARNIVPQASVDTEHHLEPFDLGMNYPNPFNAATVIPVTVYKNCRLRIELFSITGQTIGVIFNDMISPGNHIYHIDANSLSSGIIICRVSTGGHVQTRVMAHIK